MRQLLILPFFVLIITTTADAKQTVSCHCFQDRQFLPQQSHAADPYFLATAQNSLMATLYGIEKRSLVRAKMSGADGNILWGIHEFSRLSGLSTEVVNKSWLKQKNWSGVVEELQLDTVRIDPRLPGLLNDPVGLAAFLVDRVLAEKMGIQVAELKMLRQAGAGNKETILAVLIAADSDIKPQAVYDRSIHGESWGKLLHEQGLFDGDGIAQKWQQLLRP